MQQLRRIAVPVFILSASLLAIVTLGGCAGTFLSDAPAILTAILSSLAALSGVLVIFGPAGSAITAALNIALAEIKQIQIMVAEYKTTPDETLLQKIEAAISEVMSNLGPLLEPVGIPASVGQKIGAIAEIVLSQLEAWLALFPATPQSKATVARFRFTATQHGVTMVPKILSSTDFKAKINAILDTPTGDAKTDEAFAKVERL